MVPPLENIKTPRESIRAFLSRQFSWRPFPWWLTLLLTAYVLVKLQLIFESPCAVLGTPSPVSKKSMNKAFRTISMCTHPDKVAAPEGAIIFNRVRNARDTISNILSKNDVDELACYDSEMEKQLIFLAARAVGFN